MSKIDGFIRDFSLADGSQNFPTSVELPYSPEEISFFTELNACISKDKPTN